MCNHVRSRQLLESFQQLAHFSVFFFGALAAIGRRVGDQLRSGARQFIALQDLLDTFFKRGTLFLIVNERKVTKQCNTIILP
jgi:hypothetical protein